MALARLKNKHKNSILSALSNMNPEEVRPSSSNNHKPRSDNDEFISPFDSINNTVLTTRKYEKVLVYDDAYASSKTNDHSNKSKSPTNKQALTLSNVHDNYDKSDSHSNKKVLVLSNTNNHSKKSDSTSKRKAVGLSDTTDSDEPDGPSKKMALASSNAIDYSDESAGPSKIMAITLSNTRDSSNESDESSDKENQTKYHTSQWNERIPRPVAAPVVQEEERDHDLVPIGSGRTLIRRDRYRAVYWKSYNYATRTLLRGVFSKEVLSTHSLRGKRSLTFPHTPARMCLDEQKVRDIVIEVRKRFKVEEYVIRKIIDRKCSDERKIRTGQAEDYDDYDDE